MIQRPKEKTFVYGLRSVIEAIRAGKPIDKIYIQTGLRGELVGDIAAEARKYSIPTKYVPANKLNQFTEKTHQGVIAFLSPVEFQDIESIVPILFEKGEVPFVLILDGLTDIRNFGATTRVAECAGVHAVIISTKNAAAINADAVKSSAGALLRIPVCRSNNLISTLNYLKNCGLQIVSCTEKSDNLIYDDNFRVPTAVVMGGEEKGISREILDISDSSVKIPLMGKVESLNVSVAAGVVLYEVVRQRFRNE